MSEILDVDLLAFERGSASARAAVVDGTLRSLRTGFVFTSHDLPAGLLEEAYGLLARFFALPAAVKADYVAPESHGQTGYTGVGVEQARASDLPDWKEMLNWGSEIPAGHPLRARYPHRYLPPVLPEPDVPGITAAVGALHDSLLSLQERFLRVIACGIGVDEDYFSEMVRYGPTLSRAIRYPPMGAAAVGQVWAAEHTDINLITALPRATAQGLQVRTADGWVDAVPPPDHVVINTGIMLARLTNDLIPAGVHRVVAGAAVGERYSVVQFCHPTPWTILAPAVGGPARYAPIEAGALLDQVLWEINLLK